jgi:LmbE family N-acetylglucosaminyl deacetylase
MRTAVLFCMLSLAACPTVYAEKYSFTKDDRVLVVAPHPDDEAIGAAGAILEARRAGAVVRVLYLTHGDYNELASLTYLKKPMLSKPDFIRTGDVREAEAKKAMEKLGLSSASDCVFLGYPDFGMMKIWLRHWGDVKPFQSFFSRINKVPYKEDRAYGKYYLGDNIVHDIEHELMNFEPTVIFSTPPFDRHPDHQAVYLYLHVALLNTAGEIPEPRLYEYLVHAPHWPSPRKYRPDSVLDTPPHLLGSEGVQWIPFELTDEDRAAKQKAITEYKSQLAYARNFLESFIRKNELMAVNPLEAVPYEKEAAFPQLIKDAKIGDVRYEFNDKELFVTVPLSKPFDEIGALTTYVYPYKKNYPFAQMPKLSMKLFGNKLFISNALHSFYDPGIQYRIEGKHLEFRIPLRLLKYPDVLFVSTRNAAEELSLDFGAWRVLSLTKPVEVLSNSDITAH